DPIGEVIWFSDSGPTSVDVGPRDDLYLVTALAFERAIAGEGEPIVSGPDGVRSLAGALAAATSLITGRAEDVARV
ncbi:MAG: gfo/Idh/MocA family oxidoreductase, partial [bacterium]|nr:gfo/Idh/MocA family oxidoreductase [bacterium]